MSLKLKISAIEINKVAFNELKKLNYVSPTNKSVIDCIPKKRYDLVLSKGFLIHINPNKLKKVYSEHLQIMQQKWPHINM